MGLPRKCAVVPLWGHVLLLLPIGLSRLKHSRCSVLRDLWPAQTWEEGWPAGSQRWPLEEEPGDWPSWVVSPTALIAWSKFLPKIPSQPHCPPATGFSLPSGPFPSLACLSFPFSPRISHNMDGGEHLLLLRAAVLDPSLVPCPHLYLGNHLLLHS